MWCGCHWAHTQHWPGPRKSALALTQSVVSTKIPHCPVGRESQCISVPHNPKDNEKLIRKFSTKFYEVPHTRTHRDWPAFPLWCFQVSHCDAETWRQIVYKTGMTRTLDMIVRKGCAWRGPDVEVIEFQGHRRNCIIREPPSVVAASTELEALAEI